MNVDVSPDRGKLIFDLLGDLYELPIAGGDAEPLTSGRSWDRAPTYSPDGEYVYFVSDRGGYDSIWRMPVAGGQPVQVTHSPIDVRGGPNWSKSTGRLLTGIGDVEKGASAEVILSEIDPVTGHAASIIELDGGPWFDWEKLKPRREQVLVYSGVQAADGQVYFSKGRYDDKLHRYATTLYRFDPDIQISTRLTAKGSSYSEYKPQLSHDSRLLAYFRQYDDRRTEIRVRDLSSDRVENVVQLADADDAVYTSNDDSRPNYAFTPDNRSLVYWNNGQFHRVELTTKQREVVPFYAEVEREVAVRSLPAVQQLEDHGLATILRWPSFSRHRRILAFAAIGYVWIVDGKSGVPRRLTDSSDFQYMPAVSPNGEVVAYVSFARSGDSFAAGRLMIANVDNGSRRELLDDANKTYLLPSWSADGQKIAAIKEVEADDGLEAFFGWTSLTDPEFQKVGKAPPSSDFASWPIYARFVGFDATGNNLLLSYPRSRSEQVLLRAAVDGTSESILAFGRSDVGGIAPAPDLKHLALTRRDGTVWLLPFAVSGEPVRISSFDCDARRISENGAYYVNWINSDEVSYGFGRDVHWYSLGERGGESRSIKVAFERPKAAQPIAFTGARVITMSSETGAGPIFEPGTIVFDERRIVAVGSLDDVKVPADAIVLDVSGKTILPGFLDTHYHRIGGGDGTIRFSAFKMPNAGFDEQTAIQAGITSAWEPGGAASDGVPATADLQASGRIVGPRWSYAAAGGVGYPWEFLTGYPAALSAVQQHQKLGVDVLKEYVTPTRQQRQWLIKAAMESGLGIVSHLATYDRTMTLVVDGYTGGDHPYIPIPFFKDVRELLRQTGYIWTPNVVITPGTVGARHLNKHYFCRALSRWQRHGGPAELNLDQYCPSNWEPASTPYDILRSSRVAKQAASAADMGVHIGMSAHNMPGSNLHMEMWFLWKGGMRAEDVLRAATIGNAEKLGVEEDVGSLERGKIADILVLNGNPLEHILNALTLEYTIQGGVVYYSDTAQPVQFDEIMQDGGAAFEVD